MKKIKIINNTTETGLMLKEFLSNDHFTNEQLLHEIMLLSTVYDIILDNRTLVFSDKEKFDK